MIILDTNVLSALMQQRPDAAVIAWMDAQAADSIWITIVTVFEARFGLELLPKGKRRQTLVDAFEALIEQDLEGRVLEIDSLSAASAATLAEGRRRAGQPVDFRDTLIAGVALARRATIATRNVRHFADLAVPVVNPWQG